MNIKTHYFWSMPNKETFQIKGLTDLLYLTVTNVQGLWIDPFANNSLNTFWRKISVDVVTNDLNPRLDTHFHINAINFLKQLDDCSVDGVMYDPPFSLRQVKECYESVGLILTQHDTQSFHKSIRKEIARIIKLHGVCVSFGWNSTGIGKKNGFMKEQMAVICHGGQHNDTIVVWERKIKDFKYEN